MPKIRYTFRNPLAPAYVKKKAAVPATGDAEQPAETDKDEETTVTVSPLTSRKLALFFVLILFSIAVIIVFTLVNPTKANDFFLNDGKCDSCGKESYHYYNGNEYCDSCYMSVKYKRH